MVTKDETAAILADAHFRLDDAVVRIFRIVEPDEANESRSVKLLELNTRTIEVGISPVGMPANPSRGIFYPSVIIEISPTEFEELNGGFLKLPHEWQLGEELFKLSAVGAAS